MLVIVSVEWDRNSSAVRHVWKFGIGHAFLGRNGGCRGARAEGSYLLVTFCDWTPDGTVDGSKLDSDGDHHLLFGFYGFNEAQPATSRAAVFLGEGGINWKGFGYRLILNKTTMFV